MALCVRGAAGPPGCAEGLLASRLRDAGAGNNSGSGFPVPTRQGAGAFGGAALQGETVGLKSCRHAWVNIKPLNVLSS